MLWPIQIVLARCRPYKEARQDRLANVHGVEKAAEPLILEAEPDLPADERFVLTNQRQCGLFVPSPDAADKVAEGIQFRHDPARGGWIESLSI